MCDLDNPKFIRLLKSRVVASDGDALEEVAELLESLASEIRQMVKTGKVWILPDGVDGHTIELGTDSQRTAEAFGFEDAAEVRAGTPDDPEDFDGDLDDLVADDD